VLVPSTPDLSILIPTLDEAGWIRHVVSSVRASASAAGVRTEIIVCDGGSTDETVELARRSGADSVIQTRRSGRAHQLNAGLSIARGDTIGFLHADALLTPEALSALMDAVGSGHVGGWFEIDILPETGSIIGANLLSAMAWGINLRTRWFRTATADQFIFARREVIEVLGGLPDVPLFEGNRFARSMRDIDDVAVLGPELRISGRRWERNGLLRMLLLMYALRAAERVGAPTQTLHRIWSGLSSK
jgi:glycosyltransferase involved in cell wall biosynthesis